MSTESKIVIDLGRRAPFNGHVVCVRTLICRYEQAFNSPPLVCSEHGETIAPSSPLTSAHLQSYNPGSSKIIRDMAEPQDSRPIDNASMLRWIQALRRGRCIDPP